eukprot:TRINITY_DN16778_c0_g1_i2.p1 TRINITY_DN16778_c0_g1~~TRINITY_DN16778_c0_g1_i2.p1  ORF type:complete len:196 (-),score=43.59 TRINITY_DN16778_c0_g1_i2:120-707(-)
MPTEDSLDMLRDGTEMGLSLLSRRLNTCGDRLAQVEAEVTRVVGLGLECEDRSAEERQQRHQTMASLTRRIEDAVLTCGALWKGQDHIAHRLDRLEPSLLARGELLREPARAMRREAWDLLESFQASSEGADRLSRRLVELEPLAEDARQLRKELAHVAAADERHDLAVAGVQGQIDALTTLLRERGWHPEGGQR